MLLLLVMLLPVVRLTIEHLLPAVLLLVVVLILLAMPLCPFTRLPPSMLLYPVLLLFTLFAAVLNCLDRTETDLLHLRLLHLLTPNGFCLLTECRQRETQIKQQKGRV